MVHAFNHNTQKAEAGMQSSSPACSTEQVLERPKLGSAGNRWKQKAGEDVFEQGGLAPAPVNNLLGSFSHAVLASELKIEETGYGVSLPD